MTITLMHQLSFTPLVWLLKKVSDPDLVRKDSHATPFQV
jgi:hypothetical protein